MLDTIFSEEVLKRFVAEVRTSITDYGLGNPKFGEDVLLQEFQHHLIVCCSVRHCFNPF